MNNVQKIGSFLLLSTLVLGTASLASANTSQNKNTRQNSPAISTEIKAALEAGDYDAFIAAHDEDSPMLENMTEEKFTQMLEFHELMQAGEIEEAQALREELGLPGVRNGQQDGRMPGERVGQRRGFNPDIKAALEAGDYDAFITAHDEDSPMLEDMTEEKFEQMLQIHELMEAGEIEEAQALREELGLPSRKAPRANVNK